MRKGNTAKLEPFRIFPLHACDEEHSEKAIYDYIGLAQSRVETHLSLKDPRDICSADPLMVLYRPPCRATLAMPGAYGVLR